jgi:hypothetical protein
VSDCRPGVSGDGPKRQRWYAVLPRYDPDGSPLGPEALFADPTAGGEPETGPRAGEKWCERLLDPESSKRGEVGSGDVEVRRSSVEVDGPTFGLADSMNHDPALDEEGGIEHVALEPTDLMFFEPWDGESDPWPSSS